jgi:hypothetical protein
MKFGLLFYTIVSPVVLGLLFYLTVTPIALMMRLFQRILCDCAGSPMPRAIGSKGSPPGLAPEFMKN